MSLGPAANRISVESPGGAEPVQVKLIGRWRLSEPLRAWEEVFQGGLERGIRVSAEDLGQWDSSLVLFLARGARWCEEKGIVLDLGDLPAPLRELVQQSAALAKAGSKTRDARAGWITRVGLTAAEWAGASLAMIRFVGETVLSGARAVRHPRRFRWRDCLAEMQQCGAMSLPIISLISFLVGVIMAFQAAIQLRRFGADIFVADLVGLIVVRELGPIMVAVTLTGRTGAAFAAQLGNMKVGEEIDALETLGISPIDFLVLPRLIALGLMMPMLALYADCLGILGGLFVSASMLDIPASAYWIETKAIVDLADVSSGLVKSLFFGVLVGMAGCMRGLQCDRSSAGVEAATTSAVVTGILMIIVTDALFAVIYNVLGI